jgi:N-acetylneuraminate epimerase
MVKALSLRIGVALWLGLAAGAAGELEWTELAPLPDEEGFAGSFAGVSRGTLLVAGGANFPGAKPWEGGTKVWHDRVFALDQPGGEWREAGRLPRPLGYGVSATTETGVICVAGSDQERHHRAVFEMSLNESGGLVFRELPPLPAPRANLCGVLAGRILHVAGGLERPDSTAAAVEHWSLDLDNETAGWRVEPPLPEPGRMLAAMGVWRGGLVIAGGAALRTGDDGQAERVWLRDGWGFDRERGWRAIAEPPAVSVAAPAPMPVAGNALALIGGDDGEQTGLDPAAHRGFSRRIRLFDTAAGAWTDGGEAPLGLVTTTVVWWRDAWIIPGGEIRPGVRSTRVFSMKWMP